MWWTSIGERNALERPECTCQVARGDTESVCNGIGCSRRKDIGPVAHFPSYSPHRMMNFAGNVGGILVPIIVGVIVQVTGSYFLALMFFSASGVLYLMSSLIIDYSRKLPV
jgi:hypothetical protein